METSGLYLFVKCVFSIAGFRVSQRPMKSYIIHLAGDEKRRPNVELLQAALTDVTIVDAVVGRDIVDKNVIPTRPGDLHTPQYPFPLTATEIGCFLSHRACWQRIIDSGDDYGMIAEDDMAFDPVLWSEAMQLVQAHAGPDSFFRLPAKFRETPVQTVAVQSHAKLILPRVIGLQMVCQIVGRDAAVRLLAATEILDRPVDTLMQMHWVTGQAVHAILPNGVLELTQELGGSTVQTKKPLGNWLMRELKRAQYRAQLKLRPQKP